MNSKFNGVLCIIAGLIFAIFVSQSLAMDKISPEYLALYGKTSIIPPQYWSLTAVIAGIIWMLVGIVTIALSSPPKPNKKTKSE